VSKALEGTGLRPVLAVVDRLPCFEVFCRWGGGSGVDAAHLEPPQDVIIALHYNTLLKLANADWQPPALKLPAPLQDAPLSSRADAKRHRELREERRHEERSSRRGRVAGEDKDEEQDGKRGGKRQARYQGKAGDAVAVEREGQERFDAAQQQPGTRHEKEEEEVERANRTNIQQHVDRVLSAVQGVVHEEQQIVQHGLAMEEIPLVQPEEECEHCERRAGDEHAGAQQDQQYEAAGVMEEQGEEEEGDGGPADLPQSVQQGPWSMQDHVDLVLDSLQ
jgi:hypothetical protein